MRLAGFAATSTNRSFTAEAQKPQRYSGSPPRLSGELGNAGRYRRWAAVLIVLLAAYLRLNHLGWTEFKLDEANLSRLSLNLVRGVEFPLVGLGSSTGVVNLPLSAWLLAIPYALSSNPIAATAFIAATNVLAVAGCYALARRWLGGAGALAATLLLAVAPWAVIHSRKIWAQDLLPLFVVAWAWSGWLAFVERKPRALIAHALALAACIHLHYSGLWLIPVSALWMLALANRHQLVGDNHVGGDSSRRTLPYLLIAITIFILTFAPFVIADALRGGPNLDRLLDIARRPATIDAQALHLSWLMIAGQEIHSLAGPQAFQDYLASASGGEAGFALTSLVGWASVAGALIALLSLARAAWRRSFDRRAIENFMLLTWLIVPVLLQSRHSLPIFPHYFIILYPAPFLCAGRLLDELNARRGRIGAVVRGALAASLIIIAALQALQSIALQAFVAGRATPDGFGVPVEMSLRVADEAARASRAFDGAEVLVYAEGDDPTIHEGPSVFDVLLPPETPRHFVDLAQAIEVYPQGAAILVVYSPGQLPLPDDVAARSTPAGPVATIPLRQGEGAAQVRVWPGQRSEATPCDDSTLLGQWQNGVSLLRAQSSGAWRGAGGWIELCYRVAAASEAEVHWFNHIIGPDGRRWAQVDGAGYPARAWRAGDVIVLRFGPFVLPPDAPPGTYTLRVGMYTYPDLVNVSRLDVKGDGLEVELGTLP